MRVLIRTLGTKGSWQETPLETDALTIGRSSQNLIELPGLLVSPLHARIVAQGERRYRIESAALAGVEVNEVVGLRATQLAVGDVIGVGEHKLRIVEPRDGHDLVVEVELGDPGSAFARSGSRTELMGAGLRLRVPALVLALAVLVLCFVLPLVSGSLPASIGDKLGAFSARQWISGPVSPPHAHFGSDCKQCHERPFVPVQDNACLQCHAKIAHHSDAIAIRGLDGLQRKCASCHDEHNTLAHLIPHEASLCADCHAQPEFADFPDLKPAGDFGMSHPVFRPLVTTILPDGPRAPRKLDQSPDLKDHTGLIFPHDLHLKAEGVQGPKDKEQLACASCHVPATGGVGFQDLRYATHCARCHTLDTVIGESEFTLPHGDSAAVWSVLASRSATSPGVPADDEDRAERRLPGYNAPRGGAMTLDDQLADVFERRVCAKCHETERDAQTQRPRVRPVVLRHRWFTDANFTHARHDWVSCDDCHAAKTTRSSDALMLPDIASCRTCHGGVASNERVPSTCIDCHRLHRATQAWSLTARSNDGEKGNAAERSRDEGHATPER